MAIIDKAKTASDSARSQARQGVDRGRASLEEARAHREHRRLVRELGEACYREHTGEGTQEAITQRLAALDTHREATEQRRAQRAAAAQQARDIMHAGVECVDEKETVATAAQLMRDLGVGSLPICGGDDRLHGIITDRDITIRCVAAGRDPNQVRVSELAEGTLRWVDATADLGEVLQQMQDHRIKRLPVIDNHRLVGMISEADLARTLDEHRLAMFVEKLYARP
jgi:CBS domain-containing protein